MKPKNKPYPFKRKSVEASALNNLAIVLQYVVRHPEVAPRLKPKGTTNG